MPGSPVSSPIAGASGANTSSEPRIGSERTPTAPKDTQNKLPGTKDRVQTRKGTMEKPPKVPDGEWKDKLLKAAKVGASPSEIHEIWSMKAGTGKGTKAKDIDETTMDEALLSALFTAIENGREAVISPLINLKSTIAAHKRDGQTALHFAVEQGNRGVVQELLRHSKIINAIDATDSDGRTALHEAAKLGRQGMIEDLLAHRADMDAPDGEHLTPLHVVILWGLEKYAIVELLLENGAEVNTRDEYGDSPLHDAARQARKLTPQSEAGEHEEVIKLMLEYGADADVVNAAGETPRSLIDSESVPANLRQLFDDVQGKPRIRNKIPTAEPQCGNKQKRISSEFWVNIWFYWRHDKIAWSRRVKVYDLIYQKDRLEEVENEYLAFLKKETHGKDGVNVERKDIWKWIHFPANNMTWIKDFVWFRINEPKNTETRYEMWDFLERTIQERRGQNISGCIRMPHAKDSWKDAILHTDSLSTPSVEPKAVASPPTRPSLSTTENASTTLKTPEVGRSNSTISTTDELGRGAWRNTSAFPSERKLSVVLPYIDFETENYLERHNKTGNRPRQLRIMTDLETVYPAFEGLRGYQGAQTLDQSYYDMLDFEDLSIRDKDQVIYKWFLSRISKEKNMMSKVHGHRPTRGAADSEMIGLVEDTVKQQQQDTEDAGQDEEIERADQKGGQKDYSGDNDETRPSLGTERKRAKDPISKIKGPGAADADGVAKLLMIHQLWLWKLDDNTIITAFPERWHIGFEDNLLDTIRQSGVRSFQDPEQLIEHIVFECATFLAKYMDAGLGVHILDIFESCIATRSDEESACFKKFRQSLENLALAKSIDTEIGLIYEVKDICDELHLVIRVFENQRDVLRSFANIFWPGTSATAEKSREQFIQDCGIAALIRRTERLAEDAKRVLDSVDYLVQTKQAQSSLGEAEMAGKLNNFIMLFTVITVIFTPLSFLTSLFAVNIDVFPRDKDGNLLYDSRWIADRFVAGELATAGLVCIIVLLYSNYRVRFWRWLVSISRWGFYAALASTGFVQLEDKKEKA